MKVYSTDINICESDEAVKTGMTAKVTVIIKELKDVLCVPIQSVINVEGDECCYVVGSKPEKRVVKTGEFNDDFVEIKGGLKEGDKVLLCPPRIDTNKE